MTSQRRHSQTVKDSSSSYKLEKVFYELVNNLMHHNAVCGAAPGFAQVCYSATVLAVSDLCKNIGGITCSC